MLNDPSSHTAAKIIGWERPVSLEWIVLADVLDVLVTVNSKGKPKPYWRPWKRTGGTRHGRTNLAPADAKALLARLAGREPPGGR